MSAFHRGQLVRCLRDSGSGKILEKGKIYAIHMVRRRTDGDVRLVLTIDHPEWSGWFHHRFRPISRKQEGPPK